MVIFLLHIPHLLYGYWYDSTLNQTLQEIDCRSKFRTYTLSVLTFKWCIVRDVWLNNNVKQRLFKCRHDKQCLYHGPSSLRECNNWSAHISGHVKHDSKFSKHWIVKDRMLAYLFKFEQFVHKCKNKDQRYKETCYEARCKRAM